MTLARRFNAGIGSSNNLPVASATNEHVRIHIFNRRYATKVLVDSLIPALKGWAKFIMPLRGSKTVQ
jgi:hypothetical protein